MRIQLGAEIMIGTALTVADMTDYSDEIASVVINLTREQKDRPPTYGIPKAQKRSGVESAQATINWLSDEGEPTGLWVAMFEAFRTDEGELYLSGKWKPGAASATNPRFTCVFSVSDLDIGTPVNEWKQQSKTFPARDVSDALITDLV